LQRLADELAISIEVHQAKTKRSGSSRGGSQKDDQRE